MVLVRFDERKLVEFSGVSREKLLSVPWLLGGEAREEGESIVMEFNPDRPDLYSFQGVSRAIRLFDGKEKFSLQAVKDEVAEVFSIPPSDRPYFSAAIIRGVNAKSLITEIIDFQEKVHLTVGRNRKASAIGLHDLNKVKFPVTYKEVGREEMFRPLGESEELSLREFMKENQKALEYGSLVGEKQPAILDSDGRIISLPPILNSSITTVDERTQDLFVDVTGTSQSVVDKSMILMATGISYPNGSIGRVRLNGNLAPTIEYQERGLSSRSMKKMLGYEPRKEEISYALERMGYRYADGRVIVPLYRTDILGEVDIMEDVFKGIGYDNIKRKKEIFVSYGLPNATRDLENRLRNLLVGYNLSETLNSALVNSRHNSVYGFADKGAEILNPLSQEQDAVRTRMSPSLMQTFLNNFRNPYPQRIFEIGGVYVDGKEKEVLGIGIADKDASFSQIKGIFVGILEDLKLTGYEIARDEVPMYIPGRVGGIVYREKKIGFFGEVHPKVLREVGIKMPIAMGELDIQGALS